MHDGSQLNWIESVRRVTVTVVWADPGPEVAVAGWLAVTVQVPPAVATKPPFASVAQAVPDTLTVISAPDADDVAVMSIGSPTATDRGAVMVTAMYLRTEKTIWCGHHLPLHSFEFPLFGEEILVALEPRQWYRYMRVRLLRWPPVFFVGACADLQQLDL